MSNQSKPDRLQADDQAQFLRPITLDDPKSARPTADIDIRPARPIVDGDSQFARPTADAVIPSARPTADAVIQSARPTADAGADAVAAISYRVLLFTHTGLDIVPPPLSVWFLDRQDAEAVARLSSGDFDAVATLRYDGRGEPRLIGFEGDPARRDMLIRATLAERQANPFAAGPDASRPDTGPPGRPALDGDDAIRLSGAHAWRQAG